MSHNEKKRQAMWSGIRRLRTFSDRDLYFCLRGVVTLKSVRRYLASLIKGGYVKLIRVEFNHGTTRQTKRDYQLLKDVGADAPRLDANGKPVQKGIMRRHMWRTMKVLGHFTIRDLAVSSTTEECRIADNTAARYINALTRAGVLIKGKGSPATWRLLPSKYTGPRALVERTNEVYDPNLDISYPYRKGGDV